MLLRQPVRALVLRLLLVGTLTIVNAADLPAPMPPPVPGYPIGRCVKVLGVTTPEEAPQVGFEYLELALQDLLPLTDAEFARTVVRLRATGLPALAGYGFLPADVQLVGPDVDTNRLDRELRHGLTRAAKLGVKLAVFGNLLGQTRRVPEGFSRSKAEMQFAEFARRAAKEAARNGITVLIQPLPSTNTALITTVAEGLALVETVNHPNLQLLVDYTNLVEGKEDLAILHRAAPHIRLIEIQNPHGRVYPQRDDEADYAAFFRALKQGGYRGGFSIHGKPGDVFANGPRALALLRTFAADLATKP